MQFSIPAVRCQPLAGLVLVAALVMVISLPTRTALAEPVADMLSSWGGPVTAFHRVGNTGFCAAGSRLVALNMANEANIQVSSSIQFSGPVRDVAVRGQYAYVIQMGAFPNFYVVNISNPTALSIAGKESGNPLTAPGNLQQIHLYENLAYVRTGSGSGLVTYDISNPNVPFPIVTHCCPGYTLQFPSGNFSCLNFEIVGDLLYATDSNDTLRIYSLQPDPMHPALVGQCDYRPPDCIASEYGCNPSFERLSVSGNTALVTTSGSTLDESLNRIPFQAVQIIDVSNSAAPVHVGFYPDFYYRPFGTAVQGNIAYVCDWYTTVSPNDPNSGALKGLAVLDISNPEAPVLIGTYNTDHSSIRDVRVDGNRAYVMCMGQGLEVLDISDPGNPTRIGGYFSPADLRQMTKVGNRLYVVDVFNGFTILDVSNSAAPSVLGVYRNVSDLFHQDNCGLVIDNTDRAFLAAGYGGLQVVDVSNPANPTLLFHHPGTLGDGYVNSVELDGNTLHAGTKYFEDFDCGPFQPSSFFNYDISALPATITPIGFACGVLHYEIGTKLFSKGGVLFPSRGAKPINNSNPTSPVAMANLTPSKAREDACLVGDYFYSMTPTSGAGTSGFSIYDVTNPFTPTFKSFTSPSYVTFAVAVSGNLAFTSDYSSLYVTNITNKTAPLIVLSSPTGGAQELLADGRIVYSTSGGDSYMGWGDPFFWNGLKIRQVRCRADFNDSGAQTVQDLFDFLKAFFGQCMGQATPPCNGKSADFNGNGAVTVQDLFDFLKSYFLPCNLG